jgi:hypothetical protein
MIFNNSVLESASYFAKKMADDVEANWCFLQLHYWFSEILL